MSLSIGLRSSFVIVITTGGHTAIVSELVTAEAGID